MMQRTFRCSLLIVLIFIGSTVSRTVSEIISTEYYSQVTFLQQEDRFTCTLPTFPKNGNWTIIHGDGRPGEEVEHDTLIKFQCHPRYKLTPEQPYIVCDTNWTIKSMPKCLKLCPPLYSTPTTSLKCKDVTGNAISCSEATEGTYLTYQCIPYYEALGRKQSLYCRGGTWDFPKPVCQPVCGKKVSNEVRPLVFGGEDTNKFEYPWVTAIYIKNGEELLNNCGGTLINPRIVLTAAHCVTNRYGNTISEDDVEVGAGKYYNKYGDTREKFAQYCKAARVIVHEEFKGDTRRFQYDIALVVTKTLFTLGPVIQPACYSNIDKIFPHVGSIGELAGWGITEDGNASDTLRTIKIPYKEKITCTQELPTGWSDRYNFDDKMCAGFYKQNKSVCPGDSGSGLVFPNPEDNRFYVHGIVSISPKLGNSLCNSQDNALFTKVAHYYEWLDKKTTVNFEEDCTLPPFPENGKWELEIGGESLPGHIVSSTSILVFSCRNGYKLSTINSKFYCGPSLVPPTCDLPCPPPNFPPSTISECKNKQNVTIDCEDAIDGTSITYTCPLGNGTLRRKSGTTYCSGGSWGKNRPQCFDLPTVEYTSGIKVICTYVSWSSYRELNPDDFDATLCTHLVYTYIGVTDKGTLGIVKPRLDCKKSHIYGNNEIASAFTRISNLKMKNKNLRILLSLGDSTPFSRIAADARQTSQFIESAGNIMNAYNFDGLDIGWFRPDKSDKVNLVNFLRKVKDAFEKKGWLLSSSVRFDPEGTGYDPPKMNQILDWITVEYDTYGSWSYTGVNDSPYPFSKVLEREKEYLNSNPVADNWMKAGISKNKLVMTVTFYGRSFTIEESSINSKYSVVHGNNGAAEVGLLGYSEICSKNYTKVRDYDQKSTEKNKGHLYAYNSKEAVLIKGDYVKSQNFFGVNVWAMNADDVYGECGTKQVLLKHLHKGLGNIIHSDN